MELRVVPAQRREGAVLLEKARRPQLLPDAVAGAEPSISNHVGALLQLGQDVLHELQHGVLAVTVNDRFSDPRSRVPIRDAELGEPDGHVIALMDGVEPREELSRIRATIEVHRHEAQFEMAAAGDAQEIINPRAPRVLGRRAADAVS